MADTTNAEVVDFPGTPSDEAEPGTVALPERAERRRRGRRGRGGRRAPPSPWCRPSCCARCRSSGSSCSTSTPRRPGGTSRTSRSARLSWRSGCGTRARRPGTSGSCGRPRRPATTRPRWSGKTGMSAFRKDRHQRRVDMIEVPVRVLLAVPKIALGLFVVLAVLGIFLGIATKHIAEIAAPFEVVARIVEWVAIAVSVVVGPGPAGRCRGSAWARCGGPAGTHANANMTGWLAPPKDDDDTGLVITADTIVAGAPEPRQDPGAQAGVQGRLAADVPHAARPRRTRVLGSVQRAARRDGRDDRRPAARAGPERPPRRGRGVAVRRGEGRYRPGRDRRRVDRRPGRPVQGRPGVPAAARGHRRRVRGRARWRVAARRRDHGARSSATTSWRAARWARASPTPAAW